MVKHGLAWVVRAEDQKGGESMGVRPLFTGRNMSHSHCKYRKPFCCSQLMSLASLTGNHFWNVHWKHYTGGEKNRDTSQDSGWRRFR